MSEVIIAVENLSKSYVVGHLSRDRGRSNYLALRDVIARGAASMGRKAVDLVRGRQTIQGDELEEFWALKDVCFEVRRGEVLGVIGRNGAGKSTLLKILSRITEPTSGRALLRGRVASLLEVGTGFHPELTGRENIFLNGAILGMTQREIRRKFDEIVAFAEVERFLDTPVKRYSSGMYVRLAFAVAAHLEPEILVVDEVLAVGDAEFQKKCLGKMNEVSRHEGRTVLFVSHNIGTVKSLCQNVIWLEGGQIRRQGTASAVLNEYLSERRLSQSRTVDLEATERPFETEKRVRLHSLEWLSDLPLRHGEPVNVRIRLNARTPVHGVSVGIGFSNLEGTRLLTYETDFADGHRPDLTSPGAHFVDICVDSLPLGPDMYAVDIGCRSGDFHSLDYVGSCLQLEVASGPMTPGNIVRKNAGVRLAGHSEWETNRENAIAEIAE
jgi:lipopolysaccharide transport system ATP-binding protein